MMGSKVNDRPGLWRVNFDVQDRDRKRFRALLAATAYSTYTMSPNWEEMWELRGSGFLVDTDGPIKNWVQRYILEEDQRNVVAVIQNAIRNRSMFELEHRVRRVDGSIGWTLSRAVPIIDENGHIEEWFGVATDITPRKENERARSQLAADRRFCR
jgi:PAS domain-containing protein